MATFGTPENAETADQRTPETPVRNTWAEWMTLDSLIQELRWVDNDISRAILRRIEAFELNSNQDRNDLIPQMEEIFGAIGRIDPSNFSENEYAIWWHIARLEGLYNQYSSAREQITHDTQTAAHTAREEFIPNEFLVQSDSIFFSHIRDILRDAESLTTRDLIEEIQAINIESQNIGAQDWDDFFEDLRDEIPQWDQADFESFITRFRTENSDIYNGTLFDTSWWVNIEAISGDLDEQVAQIQQLPDVFPEWEVLEITVWGLDVTFQWPNAKQSALLYIYKVKLVFSELANNQENLLQSIFGLWLGANGTVLDISWNDIYPELPNTGLSWLIPTLMTIAWLYAVNLTAIAPFESGFRTAKDFLTVRFWNNNVSQLFNFINNASTSVNNTSARTIRRLPIIGKVLHAPIALVSSGAGVIWSFWTSLFNGVEQAYVDATARGIQYTIVDGIIDDTAGQLNESEEALKRVRVLEYYKNKWHFDAERIAQFERLEWQRWLISSRTETFWMRIWEIDKGQYFNTQRWATPGENAQIRWYNAFRQTVRTFTIPHFREEVINEYNRGVNRWIDLLRVIFSNVQSPENGGRIEIWESRTNFFERISAYLDLHSWIEWEDEILRESYLRDLIEYVQQGRISITPEELKQEIVHIVNGYEPKFRTLERIAHDIEINNDNAVQGRLRRFMDMVIAWEWTGTNTEVGRALSEIRNNTFSFDEQRVNYTQSDIDAIERQWRELSEHRFRESFGSNTDFQSFFQREIDMYTMIENIEVDELEARRIEIENLYNDMTARGTDGERVQVDYTNWQVNYLIQQILAGQTYRQATRSLSSEDGDIERDYRANVVRDRLRTNLVSQMNSELSFIEEAQDVRERDRLFRQFNERFTNTLENNSSLLEYVRSNREYNQIQTRINRLSWEISIDSQNFVVRENGRVTGKAAELLDLAQRMDSSKRELINELRRTLSLSDEMVSIEQLENILRAIIAWDISSISDIRNLNYEIYSNSENLTEQARNVVLIGEREIRYQWVDGNTLSWHFIYSESSRFDRIVSQWGNYINAQRNLQSLYTSVVEIERLQVQVGTIEWEIQDLRISLQRSNSPVIIPGQTREDPAQIREQINELTWRKTELERSILSLTEQRNNANTASAYRNLSSSEIQNIMERNEREFIWALRENPWFQDYAARNGINLNASAESIWSWFIEYAQRNPIVAGERLEVSILERETIDPIDRVTSIEVTPVYRGHMNRVLERILLQDAIVNGEDAIMWNRDLYRELRQIITDIDRINPENYEEIVLQNVRDFIQNQPNAGRYNIPSQIGELQSFDSLQGTIDSRIQANTILRDAIGEIRRPPAGFFQDLLRNRSTFLRSIT